ncbi:MAG: DegV family EDD domain-containing protein [Dehalococcoidia bacterium]|jgi:DegV family protein with EDD domain|nr:DegV family EDD domain-containing protein [Dehalococcoidia bacterium]
MRKVTVVTDSVACLPQHLAAEYGIHVLPVRLAVGNRVYRDTSDDLPPSAVSQLQRAPAIDTTPWSPEVYRRAYDEAGVATGCVVHVVAFSQFTSTVSLARAGAESAQRENQSLQVAVFDSATTSMAQGFVALAAARAAARGGDLATVLAAAEQVKHSVTAAFTFDSLQCLARTGRATRLAAWASSLLHVFPVVGLSQGRERPIALTRSRNKAKERLIELARTLDEPDRPLHIAVVTSERCDEAQEIQREINETLTPEESLVAIASPVTQAVAGPSLLGFALYCGQ